ncbi:DUF3817 domain-containing protein [Aeromicrobium sp.]|uniref:DUF3817 domain-containing protein n=1 Tax=Aeromicrobium sp. TaxID=1871063 RepID=UPI0030C2C5F5
MKPSTTRTVFKRVAVAEAISYVVLLIGSVLKRLDAPLDGGVPVLGSIHGFLFVAYVVMAMVAWRRFGWSLRTALVALGSSLVPGLAYWFERKADREGLLGATSAP